MSLIVGIDLGTTNSLCASFRDGTPELVGVRNGPERFRKMLFRPSQSR